MILGVDISEKQFLRAVKENPDVSIVCISSLVQYHHYKEMKQVVKALRKNDPKHTYKIMVGGGAVVKELAEQMGADGYTDNCVDAAEMARKVRAISSGPGEERDEAFIRIYPGAAEGRIQGPGIRMK